MRMKKLKRFMTAVMATALVFGVGKTPVLAEGESDFEVANLVQEYTGTGEYNYVGYVSLNGAPADAKYLELTYTGNITYLRLEFEDKDQAAKKTVWFNKNQADHFVTEDDSEIQLDVTTDTSVVIDLERSGIDISKYVVEGGMHIHYGDATLPDGTFQIKSAKLTGGTIATGGEDNGNENPPAEKQEPEPVAQGEEFVLKGDENGRSGMIGTYTGTAAYNYLGFVTTEGAPADEKYLEFTYTGDITYLRIVFENLDGDQTDPVWFDAAQAKHFVTKDGSEILLQAATPTTVVIDLEASGIGYAQWSKGFHMHYGDAALTNGTFTVTDARLTGSAAPVSTEPTDPNPTPDPTPTPNPTPTPAPEVKEPKKDEPTKAPKTGDVTEPVTVVSFLALSAAAGAVCLKKKSV